MNYSLFWWIIVENFQILISPRILDQLILSSGIRDQFSLYSLRSKSNPKLTVFILRDKNRLNLCSPKSKRNLGSTDSFILKKKLTPFLFSKIYTEISDRVHSLE